MMEILKIALITYLQKLVEKKRMQYVPEISV